MLSALFRSTTRLESCDAVKLNPNGVSSLDREKRGYYGAHNIAFSRAPGRGNVPLFVLLRPIFHGEHRCFLRVVGAQSKDELHFIGEG
jgi:hypothetical protein